ncbi:ABC transporter ATP-binding protein/permease [Rhodococcus antarcticus]|uniref:ABC transporter ATP-binding protein/permease n=1 Tax=Rhodococcus antarcticus TaxID=2987751 RepID=A0ABY6NYB8_9NOCA|nr:ABC transporter ATP-binding protein [Rhodococcus antarcticus]UZJ24041.1 ABC transporter ATP-binding protein/permease [Rhodococcus antarcticus]
MSTPARPTRPATLKGGRGASFGEAAAAYREATADRGLLRRVAVLFHPYRRAVAGLGGLIAVTSGLGVVNPLLVKAVFDRALFVAGGPRLGLLAWLCGVMVVVPLVSSVLGVGQSYLTNKVGQQVMRDLRARLFGHLQTLSLRFFTATRTGEIQSRLQNDVGGLQSVITTTASSVLGNLVVLVSTLVAMLVLSWPLTVLSLALLPLFVWLTGRVGRVRRALTAQTQAALAEMSAITQESLSVSGVLLSKTFGREDRDAQRYDTQNERLAGLQVRQQIVGRAFFAVVNTFFAVTPVLVYLVAGLQLSGRVSFLGGSGLTAGTVVAFTTLQARLFGPISQLLQTSTDLSSSVALFARVFGYLDLRADVVEAAEPVALEVADVRGEVELQDVWFSYEEEPAPGATRPRRWALRGLDLHVRPGQLVAVVGASGAGKTTISYLVPRLYDVGSGTVRLDGVDVRDVPLATLSGAIGMVTQETYLLHASVRDNLLYARPGATDAELEAATRAANVHERITELEHGYDTVVGERGYRLSGGEKQRIAIARVLLKDPRVLVLDEATSALDTVSERLVQAALEPLMAGRTTIAIAHRLSTIRSADVIVVVDAGRVVERGTHDELLAVGGWYAQLHAAQAGDLVPADPG